MISYLQNPDGSHATTPDQLANTLKTYFLNIFSTDRNHHISNEPSSAVNRSYADPTETGDEATDYTNSVPQIEELHKIIKNMRSNASPGPDGLNAAFYKSHGLRISHDVHNLVRDFYTSAFMHPEVN